MAGRLPLSSRSCATSVASAEVRYRVYAWLAFCFFLVAAAFFVKNDLNYVASDGRGYYAYLPSLVIDHDLDFSNQYREHWGGELHPRLLTERTERGYLRNRFPAGMALTIAPAFLVAHGASVALHSLTRSPLFLPDGYTVLYQIACLGFIMALGLFGWILTDRLLVEHFQLGAQHAAAGVLTVWLGSNYAYYFFREPFMVHVVSGFWVIACISLVGATLRDLAGRELRLSRLAMLVFALAMALVCRPTNIFLLVFVAPVIDRITRQGLLGHLLGRSLLLVPSLAPVLAQLFIWRQMTGRWVYYSYEGERFFWKAPALWQTLFSTRHGLFLWSPVLALAAGGIAWRIHRRGLTSDPLLLCYVLAFFVLWYLNSAWHMWWFGGSFGGRAFIELASGFALGLAFVFEYASRASPSIRMAILGTVCVTMLYSYALMYLYGFSVISRVDYPLAR